MTEIASSSWWSAKVVERLHFAVAAAAILLVLRLPGEEDLTWLGGSILIPVALLTFVRWPYGALFVLIGCSAMPVFRGNLENGKLVPKHFATGIVLLAVSVSFLAHKHRPAF